MTDDHPKPRLEDWGGAPPAPRRPVRCLSCGYDIRGLRSTRCVECNTPIPYPGEAGLSGLAVASLVMGLLSIAMIPACGTSIVPASLGMWFARLTRDDINDGLASFRSMRLADAGNTCSLIGFALGLASGALAITHVVMHGLPW